MCVYIHRQHLLEGFYALKKELLYDETLGFRRKDGGGGKHEESTGRNDWEHREPGLGVVGI